MNGLYLVYIRKAELEADGVADGAVELDVGLYLVNTSKTRSQLYHAIKRRLSPLQLLVAPLAELPKFKGMKRGATKEANEMLPPTGRFCRSLANGRAAGQPGRMSTIRTS